MDATPSRSSASSSSSSALVMGVLLVGFVFGFILLALLTVAAWLVIAVAVGPTEPLLDLNQVGVTHLNVSSGEPAGGAYLSLNITLLFTAGNVNKMRLRYGASRFYAKYRGVPLGVAAVPLGVAAVPAFEQPAHSETLVVTRLTVSRFHLNKDDAIDLVRNASVDDRVDLNITGCFNARTKVLSFNSRRVQVELVCDIVISPRKQSLTHKLCTVDGMRVS